MKTNSLKIQFLTKLFLILILIALISGGVQLLFMKNQIAEDVQSKSAIIAQSIEQGITQTELASDSIEHQIDLRLESFSKQIADKLQGKPLEAISNKELIEISNDVGVSGITLFARKEDDIVGMKSTEPSEIGFSFKEIGYYQGYKDMDYLFNNKLVTAGMTYFTENIYIIPVAQSGSNNDKPVFYKYAYYLEPGTDYIINAYVEANEIHQYTKEVGPDTWINQMKKENEFIKDIAVLDPRVFENPELETKLFPPLKKVVYGNYSFKDSQDEQILIDMVKSEARVEYTKKYQDDKVYKMFLPTKEDYVIYIALDYASLSGPLYRHSIILIVTGIISLFGLFLLTASFSNRIYEKIQQIIRQIKLLEEGDLTAKSTVIDGSELGMLSESANRMVDKLNKLVKDTKAQASKTQRLSLLLEAEASDSVEKMYEVSTEVTMKFREQQYEITEFLDNLEKELEKYSANENIQRLVEQIEVMRAVSNERTAAPTNITITLADLLQSLCGQSSELSTISNELLAHMSKFKL